MNPIRIRDIHRPLIRTKANAVRPPKPIRHSPYGFPRRIKAIYLARQPWLVPKAAIKSVHGIGKPDRPVRMNHHVINRVELPAVEGAQQSLRLEWRLGIHVDQTPPVLPVALCTEQYPLLVVDGPVGHGDVPRVDFHALDAAVRAVYYSHARDAHPGGLCLLID